MRRYIHEQLSLDAEFPFAIFETAEKQKIMHAHDCLELNLVERGCGCYVIEGKRYQIQAGDIFVINNRERHMVIPEDDYLMTVIVFDIKLLWKNQGIRDWLRSFFMRKEEFSHRIGSSMEEYPEMLYSFRRLKREYSNQVSGWKMAVESQMMYLLTMIYRCYDVHEELDKDGQDFQRMYARISRIFEYIEEHFRESIELETLANEVYLSQNYLCKCFKRVTGRTIFEYVQQVRVQYACYLLETSDWSVAHIAQESGFHSSSYFNRTFQRVMHMTPLQYKKASQKKG